MFKAGTVALIIATVVHGVPIDGHWVLADKLNKTAILSLPSTIGQKAPLSVNTLMK